jgi:peptidoglycan/LPS O-acetylase OafA/YrhL
LGDRRNIKSLTGLRGVAAVYVVAFHYSIGLPFSNPFTTFLAHGYLAVDLFFVLSGFVMALNYGHMFVSGWSAAAYRRFLGRRIARVYPLYLAGTIAACFLVLAGCLEAPRSAPIGLALALNVIMVQAWGFVESLDGPGWSISAEWAAYLLFPALLVPTLFGRPAIAWLSAFACAGVLAALCALPASFVGNARPEACSTCTTPGWDFRCCGACPSSRWGFWRIAWPRRRSASGSDRAAGSPHLSV